MAAPALSKKVLLTQPDGSSFTATQRGDEYLNWIETEDGSILILNDKEGDFEYAIIDGFELKGNNVTYHKTDSKARDGGVTKEQIYQLWQMRRNLR